MKRLLAAALLVSSWASGSGAQSLDARSMSMGGVSLRTGGSESRLNPAYLAVPRRDDESHRRWPLPLGWIQAIRTFPELDPESKDFDLIEIGQFFSTLPWTWEFRRQNPPTTDLEVQITQDQLVLELNDAREFIPDEGFNRGGHARFLTWNYDLELGGRYGSLSFTPVSGFSVNEVDFQLDESLRVALTEAEPIVGGTVYGMRGHTTSQSGFSSGVTYARELPLVRSNFFQDPDTQWLDDYWDAQDRRPRLWAGASVKRYTGLGAVVVDGDMDLTGQDPLFGDESSFDVDYEATYTTAHAKWLGDFGHGWGLDLGAVLRWERLEVGVGATDLLASITWPKTRRDRIFFDETTNEVIKEIQGRDFEESMDLPSSLLLNAIYQLPRALLAAEFRDGPGGKSVHLGSESWVRPWLALRAGVTRDTRSTLQAGWGAGFLFGNKGFDLGMQTHSRNLNGVRGISLALSVVYVP